MRVGDGARDDTARDGMVERSIKGQRAGRGFPYTVPVVTQRPVRTVCSSCVLSVECGIRVCGTALQWCSIRMLRRSWSVGGVGATRVCTSGGGSGCATTARAGSTVRVAPRESWRFRQSGISIIVGLESFDESRCRSMDDALPSPYPTTANSLFYSSTFHMPLRATAFRIYR